MKETIKKYQEEGNREVIEKVLELAEMDLKKMLDEGYIPKDELFYVAYRIRAILMKVTLHRFNFANRNKGDEINNLRKELDIYAELAFRFGDYYEGKGFGEYSVKELRELEVKAIEDVKEDIMNYAREIVEEQFIPLERAIKVACEEYCFDKNPDELTVDDLPFIRFSDVKRRNYQSLKNMERMELEKIFKRVPRLEVGYFQAREVASFDQDGNRYIKLLRRFPIPSYDRMIKLVDKLEEFNPDGEFFKSHYEEVKAQLLPPLVEGLEEALSRVDVERSPREMVKFINQVMLNKYNKAVEELEGKKRIYDQKEKRNYFIKPKYEVDPWKLILEGKTLKERGIDSFDIHLTKKQKKLLLDVYEVIELELKKENSQAFRWKKTGEPVIQKRFVAKKLGLNENSFKQRLKRAVDKVLDNWL
ncbi:hypothetical protein [Bacillus licheniformis]|uniref:hypothetical protein n=1 Tax=Bacillus licheniformis TaxID=1402 RepID=UPI002E20C8BA|nr:hypothetical protein [Bacillus licheniformis]